MRKGIQLIAAIVCVSCATAFAQNPQDDVFKGKLFAPNIILEQRQGLKLTKQQYTEIRAAVVEVQAGIAEQEWDMQEAYQSIMLELDRTPIDDGAVLKYVNAALSAENQVKIKQVTMLVRLKNLLTAAQIDYLEAVVADQ